MSPQQSAPISNIPERNPFFTGLQQRKAGFWRDIRRRWIRLKTELKAPVIAGLFAIVVAIVTGICNLGVAIYNGCRPPPTPVPVLSATPMPTPSSTPTSMPSAAPEIPQPQIARVYKTSSGTLFIEMTYEPPHLSERETLSFQASTKQAFDDPRPLLPPSKIENVSEGRTQGRLLYNPGDQPVWCRFIVTDAQKSWYGIPVVAERR